MPLIRGDLRLNPTMEQKRALATKVIPLLGHLLRVAMRLGLFAMFLVQFIYAAKSLMAGQMIKLESGKFFPELEAPGITVCRQGLKGVDKKETEGERIWEIM